MRNKEIKDPAAPDMGCGRIFCGEGTHARETEILRRLPHGNRRRGEEMRCIIPADVFPSAAGCRGRDFCAAAGFRYEIAAGLGTVRTVSCGASRTGSLISDIRNLSLRTPLHRISFMI